MKEKSLLFVISTILQNKHEVEKSALCEFRKRQAGRGVSEMSGGERSVKVSQ